MVPPDELGLLEMEQPAKIHRKGRKSQAKPYHEETDRVVVVNLGVRGYVWPQMDIKASAR